MLALSYFLATENTLAFYPETLPTMYQACIAGGLAFLGIIPPSRKARFGLLAASGTTMALLIIPCIKALNHWPGGDDGGAFGWFLIMGGASLLSILIASCTGCIGGFLLFKTSNKEESNKPDAGDGK